MLKAGRSRAGAAAAVAHTGALAGDQRVFRALFEELGAAWAEDPHELLELAKGLALRRGGVPQAVRSGRGRRTARRRRGGHDVLGRRLRRRGRPRRGARRRAARARARARLARLEAILPAAATAANPLDYTSLLWDEPEKLTALIEVARRATRASAGCSSSTTPAGRRRRTGPPCSRPCARAARTHDVTVASTLPELVSRRRDRRPAQRAAGDATAPRAAPRSPTRSDGGRDARRGRDQSSSCAKPGSTCRTARVTDDAVAAPGASSAARSPSSASASTHKAREGGVVLDLDDEAERSARPSGASGRPTLVERMAPRGTEVLVAIRRDGLVPVLVVGAGGVHTERARRRRRDPAARRRATASPRRSRRSASPIPPEPHRRARPGTAEPFRSP